MRDRIRLLSQVVTATVLLLAGSAVLVVLGIFNSYLHWDLFSPEVEKVLYGIFMSFLALGAFGVAIAFVLGIQEVVQAFRRLSGREVSATVQPLIKPPAWRSRTAVLAAALVLLILTILGFQLANQRVLGHRLQVFKLIVRDEMAILGPRLEKEVGQVPVPCPSCLPPGLDQWMKTLRSLSFFRSAVLYLPDPQDDTVLWRSTENFGGCGNNQGGFERFFIARDLDRAIHLALTGDTAWVEQMNRDPVFHWYHLVPGPGGKTRAVLEIWGNEQESFREYEAGALAAKAKAKARKP